jgi:Cu/Ag efflux protein CusF
VKNVRFRILLLIAFVLPLRGALAFGVAYPAGSHATHAPRPGRANMKFAHILGAAALVATATTYAQTADHAAHHAPGASEVAASTTDGEIRKVDKEQGKVTIKHGAIENLGMSGMTMVFKVADPKLLENLEPGDKVKFHAEQQDGALTVTAIRVVK